MVFNDDKETSYYPRKNVYEDFKESLATIASKRRASSDKFLSKTFSQNPKISPSETPLSHFYNNVVSCKLDCKKSLFENNNKNLKNMNKKFNLKINIAARDQENKENNTKKMTYGHGKQKNENSNLCSYTKTEPCYVSKQEPIGWEENTQKDKNQVKPKKKNRINKVYSMQPTINNHIKSKLDHKAGSNVGTTEEEFESEEISEGDINIAETNQIEKKEISQGVVYGIGGIPIANKRLGHEEDEFSSENKENLNKKQNRQSVIL